jgi:COP9 signalosome complex subunit 2
MYRLWFTTATKLAGLYMGADPSSESDSQLEILLAKMASTCKSADGITDDIFGKGSQLLELYALEIQQVCRRHHQEESVGLVKEILAKCNQANSAVSNPRSMAIIREFAGKIFMDQGQFEDAYNELFESFKAYADSGNSRARVLLKYVVLANMFCLSSINPFDSREARAYQDDPGVAVMLEFRLAYEKKDIDSIETVLMDPRFITEANDEFIQSHMESLLYTIKLELLENISRAYIRVALSKLADRIRSSVPVARRMILKLINDGRISGVIDMETLVVMSSSDETSAELKELEAVCDLLDHYKVAGEFHKWDESNTSIAVRMK